MDRSRDGDCDDSIHLFTYFLFHSVQPDVSGPRIQVLDDSDEEIMGTGANPFVEAQIWKESRDSAPAHLKDPVDNVHHEAVPRVEVCYISLGHCELICQIFLHVYLFLCLGFAFKLRMQMV